MLLVCWESFVLLLQKLSFQITLWNCTVPWKRRLVLGQVKDNNIWDSFQSYHYSCYISLCEAVVSVPSVQEVHEKLQGMQSHFLILNLCVPPKVFIHLLHTCAKGKNRYVGYHYM